VVDTKLEGVREGPYLRADIIYYATDTSFSCLHRNYGRRPVGVERRVKGERHPQRVSTARGRRLVFFFIILFLAKLDG
jgi:hypothetical protein